jgi:uncharacterized protein Yka (UPF0111/DUF47 family)
MIKNFYGDEFLYCNKTDSYGGIDMTVRIADPLKETLKWLDKFRKEYEVEQRLREESQAVKNAWEQYQVVKILAEKETAR